MLREEKALAVFKIVERPGGVATLRLIRGNAMWGPFSKTESGLEALGKAVAENLKIQFDTKKG